MPSWAKVALDQWIEASAIVEGKLVVSPNAL